MVTNRMKSRPPLKAVDKFLDEAQEANEPTGPLENRRPSVPPGGDSQSLQRRRQPRLQWEEPWVREDVKKGFTVQLPEPTLLKLRWIAAHTPLSMHRFCQQVLRKAIDREIEQLLRDQK